MSTELCLTPTNIFIVGSPFLPAIQLTMREHAKEQDSHMVSVNGWRAHPLVGNLMWCSISYESPHPPVGPLGFCQILALQKCAI